MAAKNKIPATPLAKVSGLVDAHTHLASCGARTPEQVQEIMARAAAAGVERLCTVGDGLEETELAVAAAHADPRVYAAVAIHPTRAHQLDAPTRARLKQLAADPRCVAIGETGLDTYWLRHGGPDFECAPLEVQLEALQWHAELARELAKPLMIHNREADAELLAALSCDICPETVILHCFSSPLAVAKQALERGWVLSFSGNVTFKRNSELRQAAALAPAAQLLVETDAPFMTPEPFRGQRNEPALIGHTVAALAAARGEDFVTTAGILRANFDRLYQLA